MPRSRLDTYEFKRRADRTPEPMPGAPATGGREPGERGHRCRSTGRGRTGAGRSFVIQEHHARSLHWDFRLERDGVLVSWALPKGLPVDPRRDHLAVPTEDHPLEYAEFEGEIPAGEYGAGSVALWDRGTYECEKWSDREVKVVLSGSRSRAEGRYVLFRTSRDGRWMIHRMDAAPEGWEPLPDRVSPMLCRTGEPPDTAGWAFEPKWDGVRAMAHVEGGRARFVSRNGREITGSYPELRGLGEVLGSRQALLDGEIVSLDDAGRPDFGRLQQRMHVDDAGRARRLASRAPVTYLAFDVLHLDGRATTDLTYDERRTLLESLHLDGERWAASPAFLDVRGADVSDAVRRRGLEGVVAKRRASRYVPGRRSADWVKAKHFRTQEVVLGGWTPGRGRRSGSIGALLLGIPGTGGLQYVGKVGTGFTDEALGHLQTRLRPLRRVRSPFEGHLPPAQTAGAAWVRPEVVGEVRFGEWTKGGRLRHPSWRGLRPDKDPADVVREP